MTTPCYSPVTLPGAALPAHKTAPQCGVLLQHRRLEFGLKRLDPFPQLRIRQIPRMRTASSPRCGRRRSTPSPPAPRQASARSTAASPARPAWPAAPERRSPAAAVAEATMPGRCAAPPAPAMITSIPRPAADFAYSSIRSGVRWAETTPTSKATSNSASACAASSMTAQSLSLPMITPTRGCPASCISVPTVPSVGPLRVRQPVCRPRGPFTNVRDVRLVSRASRRRRRGC